MNEYDVKRFGLILAMKAEIEGMKFENIKNKQDGRQFTYNSHDFYQKAEEIRDIVSKHNEQL